VERVTTIINSLDELVGNAPMHHCSGRPSVVRTPCRTPVSATSAWSSAARPN